MLQALDDSRVDLVGSHDQLCSMRTTMEAPMTSFRRHQKRTLPSITEDIIWGPLGRYNPKKSCNRI
jgi:hypothetical protein